MLIEAVSIVFSLIVFFRIYLALIFCEVVEKLGFCISFHSNVHKRDPNRDAEIGGRHGLPRFQQPLHIFKIFIGTLRGGFSL